MSETPNGDDLPPGGPVQPGGVLGAFERAFTGRDYEAEREAERLSRHAESLAEMERSRTRIHVSQSRRIREWAITALVILGGVLFLSMMIALNVWVWSWV